MKVAERLKNILEDDQNMAVVISYAGPGNEYQASLVDMLDSRKAIRSGHGSSVEAAWDDLNRYYER